MIRETGKLICVEQLETKTDKKPFVVVFYQEVDENGIAKGRPKDYSSFDAAVIAQCAKLTPGDYYNFDLIVTKAYLGGVSEA